MKNIRLILYDFDKKITNNLKIFHTNSQKGSIPIFVTMTLTTAFLYAGHQHLGSGVVSLSKEKKSRVDKLARTFIYSGFKAVDQILSLNFFDTKCNTDGKCGKMDFSRDGEAFANYMSINLNSYTMYDKSQKQFSYTGCQIYKINRTNWSKLFNFDESKCTQRATVSIKKHKNLTFVKDGFSGIIMKNKKTSAKELLGLSDKYDKLKFVEFAQSDIFNGIEDSCHDQKKLKSKTITINFPSTHKITRIKNSNHCSDKDSKVINGYSKDQDIKYTEDKDDCSGKVCGKYTQVLLSSKFMKKLSGNNSNLYERNNYSATIKNKDDINFTGIWD